MPSLDTNAIAFVGTDQSARQRDRRRHTNSDATLSLLSETCKTIIPANDIRAATPLIGMTIPSIHAVAIVLEAPAQMFSVRTYGHPQSR